MRDKGQKKKMSAGRTGASDAGQMSGPDHAPQA